MSNSWITLKAKIRENNNFCNWLKLKLAQLVWQGHNPGYTPTEAFYFEGFDSGDWCAQEFTRWDSCWYEGGWGECDVGDLSAKDNVWLYFKHKRDGFDDG